jgi:hypothetical protein
MGMGRAAKETEDVGSAMIQSAKDRGEYRQASMARGPDVLIESEQSRRGLGGYRRLCLRPHTVTVFRHLLGVGREISQPD